MAKYQKYAEYQDSGVEWLEQVPKEWDVIKIKHLSSVKRGASPRPIDDPKYFDEDGEYAWVRIADVSASDIYLLKTTQTMSELGSSLSVKLEPNELFLSIAGTVGKPCINKIKACIHDGFVYFPDLKIPNKYLFYVFAGEQAYKGLGKMGTQLNLNTDTVGDIKIALPKSVLDIQQVINFLDHETAKIDNLIAKQEKLIELLKEKRQAVISHAVIKGLNPNVPMKNSGVEWLGEVPEHWDVSRFKYVCINIIAGPFGSSITKDMYVPSGFKVYGQEQVIPNDFEIGDYYISEKNYIELNRYAVYPKDILISCVGTFGKIAVFPENAEKGIINPRLIKATVSNNFNPNFFREYLKSDAVFKQFEQLSRGGTMGVINIGILNEIIAVIPPCLEQDEIYNFIQYQKNKFNTLIYKAESAIQLMQERRTALISAAVTGKIDVRNWQHPNQKNEADVELSA
ncbi:restriction endonuclease subunit S [Acinetobacter haemolyticus]|uniref:restriction endonuclease subunit S n=1 Tax=Acinetobacter haemolyticus TaxID=29430 RepID=UPI000DE882DC|nr:restriction endonuclease subunit S [Acinetobacter haemolyticus]WHR57432.1 restriction endonuclease subunit S [Acinetobacter haemolyticus]